MNVSLTMCARVSALRVIRRFFNLEISELLHVKLVHLAVDHRTYCEIADNILKQDESGHDNSDGTFQRSDYHRLVQQQEKHKRSL